MKSGNITATDARLKNALNNSVGSLISNSVNKSVKNSVDKSKIRTGILHKFYPYLDKVEVQLDNGGEVICKILHKFSGDLIDFFTPDGEEFFDENLNEPYVIPENELTCLLADISSQDSEEYVLLGYYIPNNINLISPATPGNFKISSINATDEMDISFGKDGFKRSKIDENSVDEKGFDNLIIDDLILDDSTIQKIIDQLDLPSIVNLSDYNLIKNIPKINSVELKGNKSSQDFGLANAVHKHITNDITDLTTNYYNKNEIDTKIPTKLNQLINDSTHRTVTDNQINSWDNKSNFSGDYGDLINTPDIPTIPEVYDKSEINELLNDKSNKNHSHSDTNISVSTENYGQNLTQNIFNSYLSYDMIQVKNNKQDKSSLDGDVELLGYLKEHQSLENYYTKTQTNTRIADHHDSTKVDKINGKGLSTVDFTDNNYVHTDNNYTNSEKEKLATLENYDDTVVKSDIQDLEENKADKSELNNYKEIYYGTCSTGASTSAKVITTDDDFELRKGVIIVCKPSVTNTASNVTLNVNNTGAKQIWVKWEVFNGSGNLFTGYKDVPIYYIYDGTYWVWIGASNDNDTITGTETTIEAGVNDTKFATRQSVRNYVDNNQSLNNYYTKSEVDSKINSGGISQENDMIVDLIYPVGSIYMSVSSTNPSILFGGTWEQIEDTFLLSSGSNYTIGETGGSKDAVVVSHNHTQNAHNHSTDSGYSFLVSDVNIGINGTKRSFPASGTSANFVYSTETGNINEKANTANKTATNNSTGEDGTDKNMPPYLVVNVWKRVQ